MKTQSHKHSCTNILKRRLLLRFPSNCFCPAAPGVKRAGHRLHSDMFFDTLKITCSVAAKDILERAAQREINIRVYSEGVVGATAALGRIHCGVNECL